MYSHVHSLYTIILLQGIINKDVVQAFCVQLVRPRRHGETIYHYNSIHLLTDDHVTPVLCRTHTLTDSSHEASSRPCSGSAGLSQAFQ